MALTKKYYLKNNYLNLGSKVKIPYQIIMLRDMPPYGHAPSYQRSLTYPERQKCYGPDKKILFKKQLFNLDTPFYGHTPTTQISLTYPERKKCYGPDKKILFKK